MGNRDLDSSDYTYSFYKSKQGPMEVREGYAFPDFRPEKNPALSESLERPYYELQEVNDGEGNRGQYPEMDFRSLSKIGETDYLTHAIHKHPAIFIPHIPNYLINTFSDDIAADGERPTVLDPFNGSGSTGIEAKMAGRDYVGIEINPLSKLVSEVSTTQLPPNGMEAAEEWILGRTKEFDGLQEDYDVEFPGRTTKTHWFEQESIVGLSQIRRAIHEFRDRHPIEIEQLTDQEQAVIADLSLDGGELNERLAKWLTLMVANTVFDVSDADPGISKAYKSPAMISKIENGVHPPDVVESAFPDNLEQSKQRLIDLWNGIYGTEYPGGATDISNLPASDPDQPLSENSRHQANVDICLDDARSFELPEYENSIELAITSPPYINAINYYRGTKLRLFWIDDLLEDEVNPRELRESLVGSNTSGLVDSERDLPVTLEDEWGGTEEEFRMTTLRELDKKIVDIHESDLSEATRRAFTTWKFFAEDMVQSLSQVYEHLKPGALFFLVVGENVIGKKRIRSHQNIADIAENLGKFEAAPESLCDDEGYDVVGLAWDEITNSDLFHNRAHGSGRIEREWVLMLQKPIFNS